MTQSMSPAVPISDLFAVWWMQKVEYAQTAHLLRCALHVLQVALILHVRQLCCILVPVLSLLLLHQA